MKDFNCNKAVDFQVSFLLKIKLLHRFCKKIFLRIGNTQFIGMYFNGCFHNLILQTIEPLLSLICCLCDWFDWTRVLRKNFFYLKQISLKKYKKNFSDRNNFLLASICFYPTPFFWDRKVCHVRVQQCILLFSSDTIIHVNLT